ncbi:hypothetical protein CR513_22937, partial [Mucuna pruriens]
MVEEPGVCYVEGKKTWMSQFLEYLSEDLLPINPTKAKKLVRDASKYIVIGWISNNIKTGEIPDRGGGLFHKVDRSGTSCHYLDRKNQVLLLEENNLPVQFVAQNSLEQWDTVFLPINGEFFHSIKSQTTVHIGGTSPIKWPGRGRQQNHLKRIMETLRGSEGKMG